MTSPLRLVRVVPLPSPDGEPAFLAVDRSGQAPRAVVVSPVPAAIGDDPARLAALVRDVEAAARLHHPNVVPVIGLETAGDALAVVEAHREGATLRAVLDGGGRLPVDLAARIAIDACAGAAHVHGRDAGEGRPLAHGRIAPERIVVSADGTAALSGTGAAADDAATPAGDVGALAAVLHECLGGEPPSSPPRLLDARGVPPALAAAVDAGLRGELDGAEALARAIEAAAAPATAAEVAAYVEAIVPADEGERGARAAALRAALAAPAPRDAEEVPEDLILGEPTPLATPAPADELVVGEITPPSAAEPAPPAPARVGPGAAVPVAAALRPTPSTDHGSRPAGTGASASTGPATPGAPGARIAIPEPAAGDVEPTPLATAAPRRPSLSDAQVLPVPAPRPGSGWIAGAVAASVVMALAGFAAGLAVERAQRPAAVAVPAAAPPRTEAPPAAPEAAPAAPESAAPAVAPEPTRPAEAPAARKRAPAPAAQPKPARAAAPARPPAAPPAELGRGWLDVDAPDEADIYLDGRRIGRGEIRRHELVEGRHRVEVRLGDARTGETFTVGPGETYTYEVHRTGGP